ncbi:MAG: CoA-binding protein [Planctomycetota bacterium]|nr:MAG: CoA-binding protein [Planctomycetota bacterium]
MDLNRWFRQIRSIAVVGYSANPERPSHWIALYLEDQGFQVFRINPSLADSQDPKIYADLESLPQRVDLVDVFRAPAHVPEIARAAIRHQAKLLWLQPGAESPEAASLAEAAGLTVISGRCLYALHRQWRRAKA